MRGEKRPRSKRRQKKRWIDCVKDDMRVKGVDSETPVEVEGDETCSTNLAYDNSKKKMNIGIRAIKCFFFFFFYINSCNHFSIENKKRIFEAIKTSLASTVKDNIVRKPACLRSLHKLLKGV
ncbi:jg4632 [Pararge aegeria aegeria]|uniref:Jg4632 protein n=1 Tax=Pararge aegeria aegeria TaxID=348720 RepID=A0A8S4RKJ2_9NEOP|nr:jg4632 [Pararge aegeria aegeria]